MKLYAKIAALALLSATCVSAQPSEPPTFSPALLVAVQGNGAALSLCFDGHDSVKLATCTEPSTPWQVLDFVRGTGSLYQLRFSGTNDCVGVQNNQAEDGENLVREPCDPAKTDESQLWSFAAASSSSNSVQLKNKESQLCVSQGTKVLGNQLTLASCDLQANNQIFLTAHPLKGTPTPTDLAAGALFQVPPGEMVFISVVAGAVRDSTRAIYIFSGDADIDCNTPNGPNGNGLNPATVSTSTTGNRTSIFFAAIPGQYLCWNAFSASSAGAGAKIWSVPLGIF